MEPDIKVIRNDAHTIEEIEAMKPEAIILSPGPGKPEDAGVCIEAIKYFTGKLPIFGVWISVKCWLYRKSRKPRTIPSWIRNFARSRTLRSAVLR